MIVNGNNNNNGDGRNEPAEATTESTNVRGDDG